MNDNKDNSFVWTDELVIEFFDFASTTKWSLEKIPIIEQFKQTKTIHSNISQGKSNDWHLGNIHRLKEMAEIQNNLNDFKEECERLAKVAKFWQEEYYKLNPNFTPPKIDDFTTPPPTPVKEQCKATQVNNFTEAQYLEIWNMIFSQTGYPKNHPMLKKYETEKVSTNNDDVPILSLNDIKDAWHSWGERQELLLSKSYEFYRNEINNCPLYKNFKQKVIEKLKQ